MAPKTSASELLVLKSEVAAPVCEALPPPVPVGDPWKLAPVVFPVVLPVVCALVVAGVCLVVCCPLVVVWWGEVSFLDIVVPVPMLAAVPVMVVLAVAVALWAVAVALALMFLLVFVANPRY